MTVPQIKVKIHRRPQIKLKMLPRFPANVIGEGGIDVELVGGNLVISPDLGVLGDVTGPGAGASVAGELAVFTDGNNIEGSGIQYTDFVDATAIREKLAANTTFWVRSDGNDSNTGLSNAAGAAFLTWNALYLHVAQNYDFNGYTVTLKSGTTNVYAGGLFMNTSWVGGGGLIIDGNGCGIAETTTKAIINNVDQPGPIYIQNFAAGIATTLGSGVQNSAPSNLYILEGNVFGACQNAHIEAIQGGNIFCHYDYDLSGAGAARHAYAALGSTLVLFAEARLLSNQTFSDGFVYIEEGANLQAAGFTINLNGPGGPYTVTCPRFVVKAGRINTGGGGENFFPGTSKGVRSQGGIYDGSSGVETIYGGSAAGSGLTLVGTSNASPLLDFVNLYAGTINIGSPTAPTAISFGSPGVPFATVYYSGSTSGFTALKASAVASGTMTLPAGTDTLVGKATTDELTNKTLTVAVAKGTWTASGTWTIPAVTLGGTISGGGNPINNAIIGSSNPLAGTFTNLTANTDLTSPVLKSAAAIQFQTNGTTFAGNINTSQQWVIGKNFTPVAGAIATVNKNASATGVSFSGISGGAVTHSIGIDGSNNDAIMQSYGSGVGCAIRYLSARGTQASPTATQSGDLLGTNFGYGYATSGGAGYVSNAGAGFSLLATENYTSTAGGAKITVFTTPNTTVSFATAATFQASGGFSVGGATDRGANTIALTGGLFLGSFTVASAPTGVAAGNTAYFTNLRVFNGAGTQEGAGVGTGGMGNYNGTAWKIAGTNVTIVA